MPEARPLRGLYAITPESRDDPWCMLGLVGEALRGGARFVQYRDKQSDALRRVGMARALLTLCRSAGARLLVNDDLQLALAIGADGVHLGANDGDLRAARQALPAGRLLGASCYADFPRARAAASAGVDYVAFGAVHPSPTKPLAVRADLALFARCRSELRIPACAIGGITLDNAPPIVAAGADLLAVISDLFGAPDVAARAASYQQLFEGEGSESSQPATF
ncbi:thiamine phosphate synthase [Accumulibacter sp.]|uniref:thiamine phosphate synthase n=1 Tax=Accumulibacter sp. TaxID=2053492 RepID=UPI0025E90531|nr:thiamine phosphate synthase [Accumulibacter sp.]MCM8624929.1 thiamine phosphate synthase [Accumulibacter sp.]